MGTPFKTGTVAGESVGLEERMM